MKCPKCKFESVKINLSATGEVWDFKVRKGQARYDMNLIEAVDWQIENFECESCGETWDTIQEIRAHK